LFERPQSGENAVLVQVNFSTFVDAEEIQEFRELAVSAGVTPVAEVSCVRKKADPRYLIGEGKVEEILAQLREHDADLVLVNHELTPAQERNLEKHLQCQVLDRSGLILDIFAQRASSHEGRLQVELAQLQHLSTRLVRGWTHLERQKGGIGLRGPGETQLETDRRLIGQRIKQLNKRLQKVRNSREQGRKSRKKAAIPTVSLVGYTNAGKSTLFNRVTRSGVYAADQLFATLDPTLRRLELPNQQSLIFADTVGFIKQLPHDLVEAFRSTLEETREASVLLHVVDASHENAADNIAQVNKVLKEIDAGDVPQIEVFNKVDLMEGLKPRIDRGADGRPRRVWLSAATGEGIELLYEALNEFFDQYTVRQRLRIPVTDGRLRSRLYEAGTVIEELIDEQGDLLIDVLLTRSNLAQIMTLDGVEQEPVFEKQVINYCG
jgi:GTP-binding protein HflX